MSVEALEALRVLREQFSLVTDDKIPEEFMPASKWAKAWDLGIRQTRDILNRGVQEKLIIMQVYIVSYHKVKHYKFLESANVF